MLSDAAIIALRMARQHLTTRAGQEEYLSLYRDLQPGQNVYWNGFGDPPSLTFRAAFDDIAFNRERQSERALVKGRFAGGNLGWIMPEDMELFAALYRKPLDNPTRTQWLVLDLIERQGPLNIQQIKEETGLLVKEITPVLHRLQEAFLIYEDQYDGEWDRGWYRFDEFFPDLKPGRLTRHEALCQILPRFAHRQVHFDEAMAKAYYRLPAKDIRAALTALTDTGRLTVVGGGYMLPDDAALTAIDVPAPHFVYAMHRNDFLYKSNEPLLKERFLPMLERLPYDHDPLQYLLIDGEFRGVVVGHFHNGPYDLNDVVCDLPDAQSRREEIIAAVAAANFGQLPIRFMGEPV
ncbi:MAG: hypothetical protein IJ493_10615 [Clostridia bacterium]|nr:hypothetical protein [Clostridia bacterium]